MTTTTIPWRGDAHGKLLLTGEYAVLDGALALALPVRYGQFLDVQNGDGPGVLAWRSLEPDGTPWFEADFSQPDLAISAASDAGTAATLQQILLACRQQDPGFLTEPQGLRIVTRTDFPRAWGLGTSSTLIALLARWAGVDPYAVLFETLGGSGYDIACAFAEGPLLYRLQGRTPEVQAVDFQPSFSDNLYFVFLGKKQNSREGIRRYRDFVQEAPGLLDAISSLTRQCLAAPDLAAFSALALEHERLIGRALQLPRAQDLYFADFPGVVKSLGAWGGDFVLAATAMTPAETMAYFQGKGFSVCIPYGDMVLG